MEISELINSGVSSAPTRTPKDQLGQQDFLRLLVAQMENQDPSKPMDNFEFLSQIAQFGMVDGIQNLQTSFQGVSDSFRQGQIVQATGLLGRQIPTDSGDVYLASGGTVSGEIELPARAQNVILEVRDSGGKLIHDSQFSGELSGNVNFGWNGTNSNGEVVAPGTYRITARGQINGEAQSFVVSTMNTVDSITVAADGGVQLSLTNGEVKSLGEVTRFM